MNYYLDDIPTLFSYDEALAHYESTKPFNRGRYKGRRPLINTKGGRRHSELRLDKKFSDAKGGEVLTVTFLDRVLIEYFPDRRNKVFVRNHGGYYRSDALIAGNVLDRLIGAGAAWFAPTGTSLCYKDRHTKSGWIELPKTGAEFELKEWKLGSKTHRELILLTDAPQYGYYARRKVLVEKRVKWGAFIKYAKAAAKMVDPEHYNRWYISDNALDLGWGEREVPPTLTVAQFYAMMCDEEQWGKAIHWLMYVSTYHLGGRAHMDSSRLREKINDVLKYMYADEIFEKRQVSSVNNNGNGKYLKHKGGHILL